MTMTTKNEKNDSSSRQLIWAFVSLLFCQQQQQAVAGEKKKHIQFSQVEVRACRFAQIIESSFKRILILSYELMVT